MPHNDDIPFELIQRDAAPEAGDPEISDRQDLLARRRPPAFRDLERSASRYYVDDELLLVINMALHTSAPLLLTGEPGTGKTQAAAFIGRYFAIPVFKFFVKSTSVAQDLMYEFDAVGYLRWAQSKESSASSGEPGADAGDSALHQEAAAVREGFLQPRALWQAYKHDGDCVMLIDEIDKAPRDFPNDLLHEFDQHRFPHPFDPQTLIEPESKRPPIIVVTSNDERRLPDAFLRRCIFHHIELTPEIVDAAVANMASETRGGFPGLDEAARAAAQERFWELRDLKPALEKRPSTAELLTWLSILSAQRTPERDIRDRRLGALPALGALIKDAADRKRLRG
jgi:MoxR-like ATPase